MTRTRVHPLTTSAVALLFTAAANCWAAPNAEQKDQGALALLLVFPALLILSWTLQVAIAALWPELVRRAHLAVERHWPITALWGFAGIALVAVVGGLLSQGGKPGQGLAGAFVLGVFVFSCLGAAGVASAVGRRALTRGGAAPPHLVLVVLAGAAIWLWATLVPCLGQLAGLAGLLLSLGGAIQVSLNWRHLGAELAAESPAPAPTLGDPRAPLPDQPRAEG